MNKLNPQILKQLQNSQYAQKISRIRAFYKNRLELQNELKLYEQSLIAKTHKSRVEMMLFDGGQRRQTIE